MSGSRSRSRSSSKRKTSSSRPPQEQQQPPLTSSFSNGLPLNTSSPSSAAAATTTTTTTTSNKTNRAKALAEAKAALAVEKSREAALRAQSVVLGLSPLPSPPIAPSKNTPTSSPAPQRPQRSNGRTVKSNDRRLSLTSWKLANAALLKSLLMAEEKAKEAAEELTRKNSALKGALSRPSNSPSIPLPPKTAPGATKTPTTTPDALLEKGLALLAVADVQRTADELLSVRTPPPPSAPICPEVGGGEFCETLAAWRLNGSSPPLAVVHGPCGAGKSSWLAYWMQESKWVGDHVIHWSLQASEGWKWLSNTATALAFVLASKGISLPRGAHSTLLTILAAAKDSDSTSSPVNLWLEYLKELPADVPGLGSGAVLIVLDGAEGPSLDEADHLPVQALSSSAPMLAGRLTWLKALLVMQPCQIVLRRVVGAPSPVTAVYAFPRGSGYSSIDPAWDKVFSRASLVSSHDVSSKAPVLAVLASLSPSATPVPIVTTLVQELYGKRAAGSVARVLESISCVLVTDEDDSTRFCSDAVVERLIGDHADVIGVTLARVAVLEKIISWSEEGAKASAHQKWASRVLIPLTVAGQTRLPEALLERIHSQFISWASMSKRVKPLLPPTELIADLRLLERRGWIGGRRDAALLRATWSQWGSEPNDLHAAADDLLEVISWQENPSGALTSLRGELFRTRPLVVVSRSGPSERFAEVKKERVDRSSDAGVLPVPGPRPGTVLDPRVSGVDVLENGVEKSRTYTWSNGGFHVTALGLYMPLGRTEPVLVCGHADHRLRFWELGTPDAPVAEWSLGGHTPEEPVQGDVVTDLLIPPKSPGHLWTFGNSTGMHLKQREAGSWDFIESNVAYGFPLNSPVMGALVYVAPVPGLDRPALVAALDSTRSHVVGFHELLRDAEGADWTGQVALRGDVLDHGEGNTCRAVYHCPDDGRVLTGTADTNVRVWSPALSGEAEATLVGHDSPVHAMTVLPDGRHLATSDEGGTIRIWDRTTWSGFKLITTNGSVRGMFTDVHEQLLAVTDEPEVFVLNWEPGFVRPPASAPAGPAAGGAGGIAGHIEPIFAIGVLGDGRVVTGDADGELRVWDTSADEPVIVAAMPEAHRQRVLAIHVPYASGTLFLTSSSDHTAKAWLENGELDGDAGRWHSVAHFEGHTDEVNSSCIMNDRDTVVTASDDKTLRVWSKYSGEFLRDVTGIDHSMSMVAALSDGSRVVAGGQHMKVVVANIHNGTVEKSWMDGTSYIWSLQLRRKDPRYLITGSSDAKLRIWDLDAAVGEDPIVRQLTGHQSNVDLLFEIEEGVVVSGAMDGTLRVWNVESGKEVACVNLEEQVTGMAWDELRAVLCVVQRNRWLQFKWTGSGLEQDGVGASVRANRAWKARMPDRCSLQ